MAGPQKLPFSPGDVVAGKYRIEGVLGAGGMATVFSAWHEELEQRVALKMLHGSLGSDPTTVKRFVREAQNAARIQSEHVARIMDVGRVDDGRVYIVMEYLEGNDLSRVLKTRGALTLEDVADYLIQACDAIAVAHAMGIVHRDLKPANLFLTQRIDGTSCVKVLDFGIAKAQGEGPTAGEMTLTTSLVGSPLYMAPEQMASARDVDRRADLWSLGVIAYRLLTTQLPYRGDNLVELAMTIAAKPPTPLRTHRPDLPAEIETLIARCLERDRDRRWPDVGAFAAALLPFAPAHAHPIVRRIARITEAGRDRSPAAEPTSGDFEIPLDFPTGPSQHGGATLGATLAAPSAAPPALEEKPRRRSSAFLVVGFVVVGTGVGVGAAMLRGSLAKPTVVVETPAAAKPSTSSALEKAAPVGSVTATPPSESVSDAPPPASASVAEKPLPKPPVYAKPIATAIAKPTASAPKKPGDPWGWGE